MESNWRKSSHSSDQGGECVDIAELPDTTVGVRDSKTPAGPVLPRPRRVRLVRGLGVYSR
jgi:hypothetical protein